MVSVNKNAKKHEASIQPHDRTSLVNTVFVVWPKRKLLLCGTHAGNPERARWAILPLDRIANQNAGFALSFPLADSAVKKSISNFILFYFIFKQENTEPPTQKKVFIAGGKRSSQS